MESLPSSTWLRVTRLLAFGCLVVFVVAEIFIRIANPAPRVQIVRKDEVSTLEEIEGDVIWSGYGTDQRLGEDCLENPRAEVILVVGSSIAFGSGLEGGYFSERLQNRLDNREPDRPFCVVNISQPGFVLGSKKGVLNKWLKRVSPSLVFVELFYNDSSRFVKVGDTAYNVGHLETDEADYPNLFGLPAPINGTLLQTSKLYEYLTLTLARRKGMSAAKEWEIWTENELEDFFALEDQLEVPFIYGVFPNLHTPLAEQADNPSPEYDVLEKALTKRNRDFLRVSVLLREQELEDIRLDECCHLNARGHTLLEERMWPRVRDRLASRKP